MPTVASSSAGISLDEVQLAGRNHSIPLEALRYPITPIGLHYLLIHFDIPKVEVRKWSLSVSGCVRVPLKLSLEDLRKRARRTILVTLECAGNGRESAGLPRRRAVPWLHGGVGTAEWTGTPLRPLLEEAGVADGAVEVLFTGLDEGIQGGVRQFYQRSVPVNEALRDEVLLAYAMNGQPLPPQHGFPLRLIVPGWYGMAQVKWLSSIKVLDRPFDGYQQQAYRYKSRKRDPGTPVTRILPRSLMCGPGVPEFMSRSRTLTGTRHRLDGRAWSGSAEIVRVEVSVDGGITWADAHLGPSLGQHAWRSWTYDWHAARSGSHDVCSRATDALGNTQPIKQPRNLYRMGYNMVQHVRVVIE